VRIRQIEAGSAIRIARTDDFPGFVEEFSIWEFFDFGKWYR